ncbi:uncharacterized protein I303_107549 [Kwoniella dejecticola CBS 10117]|uniref:NAD-dependent epimerase/dehydratase domain-containing protein n=1 Tax=Kwoniella dejecticola CBS 10117 TaxID=1296121 RepID=A0AAJ8KW44_9TREE
MPIQGIPKPAVPYGSLIVVSGATGFIGSHVVDQALAAGYRVRGTTRNLKKGAWEVNHFKEKYGEGLFELCASGFIHVANDMTGSRDADKAISRAVDGVLNAAKASYTASVRRFVFTSSSFAVTLPKPGVRFTLHENTYNEEAVEMAKGVDPPGDAVYAASKVLAERALFNWAKENAPDMVINCLCPNGNIGPIISTANQGFPTSTIFVDKAWHHDYEAMKDAPPQHYINVQDDAKLHIIALADPEVVSERVFGTAGPFNMQDIVECLRKLFPQKHWDDFPDDKQDLSTFEPRERAESLLQKAYGHGHTSLLESVRDNARDLARSEGLSV